MEYRGAQIERWHSAQQSDSKIASDDVRKEFRATRADTWAKYFHVKLVMNDEAAVNACSDALEKCRGLSHDHYLQPEDLDLAADEVRELAKSFVAAAAKVIGIEQGDLLREIRGHTHSGQ